MQRIRQLDGVRAIAILLVFVHHASQVKLLWIGVDLFFVLSGFLITGVLLNAKKHSLKGYFAHFYARRARRLAAPYILILILVSLVFGTAWMQHWYFYILLTNFVLPLHIPHPAALEPLWSLAVEEQFYLVWPFAVYFLSEKHLRRLCIALIVFVPVLRGVVHFNEHWPIYTLTPFRMDLLAAGGLLMLEWRAHRERIERWGWIAGPLFSLCGFAGLFLLMKLGITTYGNTPAGNVLVYEACLLIMVGFMLYALAGRGVGWLKWGALTYIGTISYSMYLVHTGALELVDKRFHGVAGAILALSATIAYGALSWSLIESKLLANPRKERGEAPLPN